MATIARRVLAAALWMRISSALCPSQPCPTETPCCSQWGYCGTSEEYCGAGCQSGCTWDQDVYDWAGYTYGTTTTVTTPTAGTCTPSSADFTCRTSLSILPGQTLQYIATYAGVSLADLMYANALTGSAEAVSGSRLLLPPCFCGASVPSVTPPTTTTPTGTPSGTTTPSVTTPSDIPSPTTITTPSTPSVATTPSGPTSVTTPSTVPSPTTTTPSTPSTTTTTPTATTSTTSSSGTTSSPGARALVSKNGSGRRLSFECGAADTDPSNFIVGWIGVCGALGPTAAAATLGVISSVGGALVSTKSFVENLQGTQSACSSDQIKAYVMEVVKGLEFEGALKLVAEQSTLALTYLQSSDFTDTVRQRTNEQAKTVAVTRLQTYRDTLDVYMRDFICKYDPLIRGSFDTPQSQSAYPALVVGLTTEIAVLQALMDLTRCTKDLNYFLATIEYYYQWIVTTWTNPASGNTFHRQFPTEQSFDAAHQLFFDIKNSKDLWSNSLWESFSCSVCTDPNNCASIGVVGCPEGL